MEPGQIAPLFAVCFKNIIRFVFSSFYGCLASSLNPERKANLAYAVNLEDLAFPKLKHISGGTYC